MCELDVRENVRNYPKCGGFRYIILGCVTSIPPSPHGTRHWLKCPQYTGTNHMPVYGGTNQVYAVTAGATVPAAFAGVHRNHHFDTIRRLHPLLHPLNTGDALSSSGHWIRLLFILWKDAEQSFCSRKKEILQRWGCNISFLLL